MGILSVPKFQHSSLCMDLGMEVKMSAWWKPQQGSPFPLFWRSLVKASSYLIPQFYRRSNSFAVFSFGSGEKGQLGHGRTGERIVTGNKIAYDVEPQPSAFTSWKSRDLYLTSLKFPLGVSMIRKSFRFPVVNNTRLPSIPPGSSFIVVSARYLSNATWYLVLFMYGDTMAIAVSDSVTR